jgi:hypothetical protein
MAFILIGGIMNEGNTKNLIYDNTRYMRIADDIFEKIGQDIASNPDILTDSAYLDKINEEVLMEGGYVIVRQSGDIIS